MYEYGAGQYLIASVDLLVTGHVIDAAPGRPALGFGMTLKPAAIAELLLQAGPGDLPRSPGTARPGIAVSDAPDELLDASRRQHFDSFPPRGRPRAPVGATQHHGVVSGRLSRCSTSSWGPGCVAQPVDQHSRHALSLVGLPSWPASRAMRVAPIGRALRVASDRAPTALHLMSLVRTETEAVITVVMRVYWPPDRPRPGREIIWAGPHHLPYDQLWAVDDQGARYTVRFEGGRGGTATWRGIARLSPVPPRSARRLDLVGDGTRLIQLPLRPLAARGGQAAPPAIESVVIPPGERLLVLQAERILASGDARGPVQGPVPGEIITVLTETGAIAADSPVPGQLAALCQRLGAAGHGITVPPALEIPAPWASVIAHRDAPVPAGGPEMFAPLACVLPDVDGARFALAGLSTAAGESHLHVVSSGMPPLTDRFAHDWTPGFSWWLRDGTGNWHVAADEPSTFGDGMQAFGLRLAPPLAAVPDAAEVVVTGPATRVRALVPVRPALEASQA